MALEQKSREEFEKISKFDVCRCTECNRGIIKHIISESQYIFLLPMANSNPPTLATTSRLYACQKKWRLRSFKCSVRDEIIAITPQT